MAGWAAVLTTLAYICALFFIAHMGDQRRIGRGRGPLPTAVYALGLGVYCTSWTFFGSVGLASSMGFMFLTIYVGPLLVVVFGRPLIKRIARLSKAQNITSVADFVAARYGKSEGVAITVALLCVIGTVPYIALQLKAVAAALDMVVGSIDAGHLKAGPAPLPLALIVAVVLAGFAMAFGTRRVDATEHQDGLMLAIASESLVKLVAFLLVGVVVTWWAHGGFADLAAKAFDSPKITSVFTQPADWATLIAMTFLSAVVILLLPRQFHVTIVENRDERDVDASSWLFPLYLIAINIFVAPLAVAGLLAFSDGVVDRDMTVLALPLKAGQNWLAVIAMLGGISAATAMIVVECVALSIMVSNDLLLPMVLRRWSTGAAGPDGSRVLVVRRVAIVVILALGYLYLRVSNDAALAAIGLMSFACISQIASAFFGGLFWRGGTALGAMLGVAVGEFIWAYTLLLPSLAHAFAPLQDLVRDGPGGVALLRPTALFGLALPELAHGAFVSLAANIAVFVGVSLARGPSQQERLQALAFVRQRDAQTPGAFRLWRSSVTAGELESTVARYLGAERTRASFESFFATRDGDRDRAAEADVHTLRFAERLLASAIGAASSRLVLSLALKRRTVTHQAALQLVDEASAAIQYNRDLLQYALDFARQGITVYDRERRLICWNREFRDLFDLPHDVLRVGVDMADVIRFNAERGLYGLGPVDDIVRRRVNLVLNERHPTRVRLNPSSRVIEVRSAAMPDGGYVTTYTDVTAQVEAEEALEATNETLEQRVRDRTTELERLNRELAAAKAAAEEANLSKTRFLAAASHDILQPLNAARLYATSLAEQARAQGCPAQLHDLSDNVDASLEAVEDILTTLLDISRLDAGAMKAEIGAVRLDDLFQQLKIDFAPQAAAKNLALSFVRTTAVVRADRRLLRRLLQNFVSNAVKYTPRGKVLVGVRRAGAQRVRIEVWDTGVGIPEQSKELVFREFARLDSARRSAPGVGLGLSIVERIARVLDVEIDVRSTLGAGSVFSADVPRASLALADPRAHAERSLTQQMLDGLIVALVDNEPSIVEGMTAVLQGWGCTAIAAGTIDTLTRALEQGGHAPHGVVADYHLDGEDGFMAIAAVRARYGARVPAVLATADRTESLRRRAAEADVRVLPKPVKPAALRALLGQWRARVEP